jgi:hypothetical protein
LVGSWRGGERHKPSGWSEERGRQWGRPEREKEMQRDCLGADQLSRQRLVGGLTIFAISGTASDVALSGKEYLSCKPFF